MKKALSLALALCLQTALPAKPSHVVFAYSASWMDTYYPPTSYNWDAMSHVARAFLEPRPDGSIGETAGFYAPGLEEGARAHGVKLIASLGGASVGEKTWLAIAREPKARERFYAELARIIDGRKWDGIDIDWEPGPLNQADSEAYTSMLLGLRKAGPAWIIASAMTVGEYWSQHRQWDRYFPALNFVNAMTYDMAGDWVGRSSHDNALYLPDFAKGDPMMTSVDTQVSNLSQKYKVPKDRILVGLRFDGFAFGTKKMGDKYEEKGRKKAQGYNLVEVEGLRQTGLYKEGWDKAARAPYLERKKGAPHTVTYNNPRAIKEKVDYVKKEGYAGVIIWALGGDVVDGKAPLLDEIAKGFGVKPRPLRSEDLSAVFSHRAGRIRKMHGETMRLAAEVKEAGKAKLGDSLKPKELPAWLDSPKPGLATLKKAEKLLGELAALNAQAEHEAAALPMQLQKGKALGAAGQPVRVDDFEDGDLVSAQGGSWEVDVDMNGLGSTVNPKPLALQAGGAAGRHHLKIWGHFGKNVDPWPHANATLRLLDKSEPADLTQYKTLEFMAKGDGKTYEVLFQRAAVKDFCHFRISFTAPKEWAKVSLDLSKAEQPKWGKALPWQPVDVRNLVFTIIMATANDEDYELAIDDLRLLP